MKIIYYLNHRLIECIALSHIVVAICRSISKLSNIVCKLIYCHSAKSTCNRLTMFYIKGAIEGPEH